MIANDSLPPDPVKEDWERVILENKPPGKSVRPEVLQSWYQSKEYGIDPFSNEPPQTISGDILDELIERNTTLIEFAKPVMQMVEISVRGTRFLTTLSDKSGHVLLVLGKSDIIEMAKRNYYLPGCRRDIPHAGTNAIGLSLQEDKPIQLTGCEHYRTKHHDWTCSSAPIHNSRGEIMGTVTLSGHSISRHQHTLALVTAAAETIESQIREYELIEEKQRLADEKQRLNSLISSIFNSVTDGFIALDRDLTITHMNNQSLRMLSVDRHSSLGHRLEDVTRPDETFLSTLHSKRSVSSREVDFVCHGRPRSYVCSVVPIQDAAGQTLGKVITLIKKGDVINIAKKFGGNYAKYEFDDIKGDDPDLKNQVKLAKITAKTNSRVLIFGESGTGKELFAQAIHNHSDRSDGPFVAISCATIPRDLFEAELFGYRPGAFTGARQDGMVGKFELAHKGSLFLDEINALPLDIQAKLLRVLQQGEITRLGDTRSVRVDVRVIAATNTELLEEVQNQNFREDLYYRINVVEIIIPPLRKRSADIDLLIDFFMDRLSREMGVTRPDMSEDVMEIIHAYEWPGNVRELEHCIERAIILSQGGTIVRQHLPARMIGKPAVAQVDIASMRDSNRAVIEAALQRCGWNASQAARELKIGRSTLYRKMKEFGLR